MVDPIRNKIVGHSFTQDRLWKITKDNFLGAMTDYNWEITGVTPNIAELDESLRFAGNAWYWTAELGRRGYKVEHIEDRR